MAELNSRRQTPNRNTPKYLDVGNWMWTSVIPLGHQALAIRYWPFKLLHRHEGTYGDPPV